TAFGHHTVRASPVPRGSRPAPRRRRRRDRPTRPGQRVALGRHNDRPARRRLPDRLPASDRLSPCPLGCFPYARGRPEVEGPRGGGGAAGGRQPTSLSRRRRRRAKANPPSHMDVANAPPASTVLVLSGKRISSTPTTSKADAAT